MTRDALRRLPSVESVLSRPALEPYRARVRAAYLTRLAREVVALERERVLTGAEPSSADALANRVAETANSGAVSLRRVVNATGTLTHTNLGRSLLSDAALSAIQLAGANPVNLEYDILAGERGHRDALVENALCRLTGAEAATVVNNNAAAALLALKTLAEGREVVVSRGELVEIGGSFRVPDVMLAAGVTLREVGTTNRTHPRDYVEAVNERTALFLKVHPSNYRVEGFTREVTLEELVALGHERGIPVMEDLGSGALVDLRRWKLPAEPVVSERVKTGVDIVTFSGDKLLGGPQAGIVVGRGEPVERIRRHPLMRAVRVDKLTLAALDATLAIYEREPNPEDHLPMLCLMTRPVEELRTAAESCAFRWRQALEPAIAVTVEPSTAEFGSGSQPGIGIPSVAVTLRPERGATERIARALRSAPTPVIARVGNGRVWLDFRALRDDDLPALDAAIERLAAIAATESVT